MAKLPDIPEGRDLEWSVAAALQTSGYYIDKNVAEKFEGTNLLELDAVATRYSTGKRSEVLVEVKGGTDWGFADLFQLRGRMHYRGIHDGILFVTQCSAKRQTAYEVVAERLGLKFIVCSDPRTDGVQAALATADIETSNDIAEHDFWRFVYWAERTLVDLLVEINKESRTKISIAAKKYHYLINDYVFFTTEAIARANALYSAFFKVPKISQEAVAESLGKALSDGAVYKRYSECINSGSQPLVQACLYLEHRARLSILRAAVDYACFQRDKSKDHGASFKSLPGNFASIVASLEEDHHACLYPYFWQVFFWAWGGFVVAKNKATEYAALSLQTGVPVDAIDNAIGIYNELFPTPNGWLQPLCDDELLVMKLVPPAIHGLGAFHRLTRAGAKTYADLGVGPRAQAQLSKWHNIGVSLIERKRPYDAPKKKAKN